MITSLDETIPYSRRHPKETIRQILRYDSGYLKDLFVKNEKLYFTPECFSEICLLTKGHNDNWEKPIETTSSIFSYCKPYATPYLYDFNDESLILLNNQRILYHGNH